MTIAHNAAHDFNASEVTVSYNFSRADNELLSSLDWKSILEQEDVETAARTFSNILTYVIDRHVPKTVRV